MKKWLAAVLTIAELVVLLAASAAAIFFFQPYGQRLWTALVLAACLTPILIHSPPHVSAIFSAYFRIERDIHAISSSGGDCALGRSHLLARADCLVELERRRSDAARQVGSTDDSRPHLEHPSRHGRGSALESIRLAGQKGSARVGAARNGTRHPLRTRGPERTSYRT